MQSLLNTRESHVDKASAAGERVCRRQPAQLGSAQLGSTRSRAAAGAAQLHQHDCVASSASNPPVCDRDVIRFEPYLWTSISPLSALTNRRCSSLDSQAPLPSLHTTRAVRHLTLGDASFGGVVRLGARPIGRPNFQLGGPSRLSGALFVVTTHRCQQPIPLAGLFVNSSTATRGEPVPNCPPHGSCTRFARHQKKASW
jgi:hypothetical protein